MATQGLSWDLSSQQRDLTPGGTLQYLPRTCCHRGMELEPAGGESGLAGMLHMGEKPSG